MVARNTAAAPHIDCAPTLVDMKSLSALADSAADWVPTNRGKEARAKRTETARSPAVPRSIGRSSLTADRRRVEAQICRAAGLRS